MMDGSCTEYKSPKYQPTIKQLFCTANYTLMPSSMVCWGCSFVYNMEKAAFLKQQQPCHKHSRENRQRGKFTCLKGHHVGQKSPTSLLVQTACVTTRHRAVLCRILMTVDINILMLVPQSLQLSVPLIFQLTSFILLLSLFLKQLDTYQLLCHLWYSAGFVIYQKMIKLSNKWSFRAEKLCAQNSPCSCHPAAYSLAILARSGLRENFSQP